MPSSGYAAWSVIAGEQPTAAKWNILGSNDAAFNNGNGFEDGILIARHFANNAVPGNGIATNAITLGYASKTDAFSTTATAPQQVTGMSIPVTVPAGGRRVKVSVSLRDIIQASAGQWTVITIWDGAVGSGTKIGVYYHQATSGGQPDASACFWGSHVPSAGAHTYNLGVNSTAASTATISANSTEPGQMIVELV